MELSDLRKKSHMRIRTLEDKSARFICAQKYELLFYQIQPFFLASRRIPKYNRLRSLRCTRRETIKFSFPTLLLKPVIFPPFFDFSLLLAFFTLQSFFVSLNLVAKLKPDQIHSE